MTVARAVLALALLVACSPGTQRPPPVSASVADIAYVTGDQVLLRGREGAVRALGTVPADERVSELAWSVDGRYLAWLRWSFAAMTVQVHDVAADRTGTWVAPSSPSLPPRALGASGAGFVVQAATNVLAFLDPRAVLAGRAARLVPVTGALDDADLLTTSGTRILVTAGPGAQTVYDVGPDGRATLLYTDGTGNRQPSGAALTADGRRLVYTTILRGDEECTLDFRIVTRDLVANREDPASMAPRLPIDALQMANATTGPNGRTFAAVSTEIGVCDQPVTAWLFVLSGDRWSVVDRDATWGASAADGRLAVIRTSGALVVDGATVASGVAHAAWAPVPG